MRKGTTYVLKGPGLVADRVNCSDVICSSMLLLWDFLQSNVVGGGPLVGCWPLKKAFEKKKRPITRKATNKTLLS